MPRPCSSAAPLDSQTSGRVHFCEATGWRADPSLQGLPLRCGFSLLTRHVHAGWPRSLRAFRTPIVGDSWCRRRPRCLDNATRSRVTTSLGSVRLRVCTRCRAPASRDDDNAFLLDRATLLETPAAFSSILPSPPFPCLALLSLPPPLFFSSFFPHFLPNGRRLRSV